MGTLSNLYVVYRGFRRKGGDAKYMPTLRRLQPRASSVQSAEGSVPHALGSTATEPARSRQTILPDPLKRGRSNHIGIRCQMCK